MGKKTLRQSNFEHFSFQEKEDDTFSCLMTTSMADISTSASLGSDKALSLQRFSIASFLRPLDMNLLVYMYLGKPSKINKWKMWIFSTLLVGGVNLKSTLLKKCGFSRGGSWVGFPHFFRYFLLFLKNFVLFYPVFVCWKVIFREKLERIFFPQNVFPHFRGGGSLGGEEKIHTFYLFFEGFP